MSTKRPTKTSFKYYDLSHKYRNRFRPVFVEAGRLGRAGGSSGGGAVSGYNQPVEFSLRDFRPAEIETLWRIDQQCFAPGISYSRQELAAYLRRPGAFALVAEWFEGGGTSRQKGVPAVPVGFIVAELGKRGTGHVITIDVLHQARKAGIGSRLLRAAEDRLRAAPCCTVILETAVDNQAALSFYKRHRYVVVKTLPRYYSNGVDAFVLEKDLLSPAEPDNLPQ